MPFTTRAAREIVAAKAVEYVQSKLTVGASNIDNPHALAQARVVEARNFTVGGTSELFGKAKLFQIASSAVKSHAGNCGEQAAVAFKYLYDLGIFPLDYVSSTREDHAWLVIGRPSGTDIKRPEHWGDDWVVCDPWNVAQGQPGVVSDADEYEDIYDAYYVALQVRSTSSAVGGVAKSAESPF